MKRTIIVGLLLLTIGGLLMFGFSGCFGAKYKIDYNGGMASYRNARDAYRAGEQVTLYYPMIATDTDYSFYLDGERLNYSYEEGKGFVLTFTMPDHDVSLECHSRNSMIYQP